MILIGVLSILKQRLLITRKVKLKILVMGKQLFWSLDRLVKHEFDCLRLELDLGLGLQFGFM